MVRTQIGLGPYEGAVAPDAEAGWTQQVGTLGRLLAR
jgi:hypothetical protein